MCVCVFSSGIPLSHTVSARGRSKHRLFLKMNGMSHIKNDIDMASNTSYLVEHGLPGLLNELVEAVISDKPSDALSYCCQFLENKKNVKLLGQSVLGMASGKPSSKKALSPFEIFGKHVFQGATADQYLKPYGMTSADLKDPSWTRTKSDEVAAAVLEWAKANGATVYTHWFQPLGSSGVRPGQTGQVHNNMFVFGSDGNVHWDFDGKTLLKGETDGSSYPNGGLRATHTAGGYTVLDPTSPIFLRDDTVYIPSCFVTWHGHSMDEKTPLLRAQQAMSKQGIRLMNHLGYSIKSLNAMIGSSQLCREGNAQHGAQRCASLKWFRSK